MIGTLAVDGWAVTFGTARRGLGRAAARRSAPPRSALSRPLLAVQNVTARPSTASVPITVTLRVNVRIKGLNFVPVTPKLWSL